MKILACVLLVIALSNVVAEKDVAVTVYPNSTEMPEATALLMEMKASSWIAARAYRTDDSIKNVVQHFRTLAAKAKKPSTDNELLKRLLQDNWKITDGTVSGANVVFGGSKSLSGIAREETKGSFGTILLDDSLVRVHVMTPYPIPPEGMNMADGTMIVLIRERIPDPAATAADADPDEPVYTGKEVTRKVVLRSKPEPNFPAGVRGTVVLKAVFASSGKVTRIVVVQSVPGMTEEAIRAARRIEFHPAIKDGRYVAMWMQLEYNHY
jgi:TonB family protein